MFHRAMLWAPLLAACGAAEPDPLRPEGGGAVNAGPAVVDLGITSAGDVAEAMVEVQSWGDSAVALTEARVIAPRDVFEVEPLFSVLPAGQTGRIAVRYGPCADAVSPCDCELAADLGTLVLSFDNADDPDRIELRGATAPPGPDLVADPADVLDFALGPRASTRTATLTLRNEGCAPLTLGTLEVFGPGGIDSPRAGEEFRVRGCGWPCRPGEVLCADANAPCASLPVVLEYANSDAVTNDLAELRIAAVSPDVPDTTVVLRALTEACPPPVGVINVRGTAQPCVGRPVFLDLDLAPAPPNADTVRIVWSWQFSRPPIPEIEPSRTSTTVRIVPQAQGIYLLEARAFNACGAIEALTAQINVAPNCL